LRIADWHFTIRANKSSKLSGKIFALSLHKSAIGTRHPAISNRLVSAEDLIKLSHDGYRYELIKGELLTMSPAGEQHGAVIMNLAVFLGQHVKANKLGQLYAAETGFKLESDPDTVLAPDISFIKRERVGKISLSFRDGAPDLAVEVTSPGESRNKVAKKAKQWLELGALLVWVVDPQRNLVTTYRSDAEARVLTTADVLSGDDVVPGFRIPVCEIFSLES
jgi:Uma2 family endonuclease